MNTFRLSEDQRIIFREACKLFLEQGQTILGRFSLWLTNFPRARRNKKLLKIEEVKAIQSLDALNPEQLHTAVLLLDYMSASMVDAATGLEEFLYYVGAFDDGEYEESEFIKYRRLFFRLNRECSDSIYDV